MKRMRIRCKKRNNENIGDESLRQKSLIYAPLIIEKSSEDVAENRDGPVQEENPKMEKNLAFAKVEREPEKEPAKEPEKKPEKKPVTELKPERESEKKLEPEKERRHHTRRKRRKKTKNLRENSRRGRKKKEKKNRWKIVVAVLGILIILLIAGIFVLRNIGRQALLGHDSADGVEITAPEDAKVENGGKTVSYRGKTYQRNDSVTAILCMGVDKDDMQDESNLIGENGQADTVIVTALDTDTGKMTLINISRDAIVDVDVYNMSDQYVKTENMQICLAYAYGDGRESSCENMIKSVSRLLYGIPIDGYVAIDIPAINSLNDAIGGVDVTVLEDMTDWDPEFVQGATVHLQGKQAETYVRSRYSEGEKATVDSNNYRMARQRQYVSNFISKALSETKSNPTLPVTLYNTASPYMVTDITVSEVTYLTSLLLKQKFDIQDIVTVPGEVKMGERYAEYYVNEEELYQIILDVFYTEK